MTSINQGRDPVPRETDNQAAARIAKERNHYRGLLLTIYGMLSGKSRDSGTLERIAHLLDDSGLWIHPLP